MADLFALRHTLNILSRLGTQPREAIYLVLNQASETSSLTPRAFQEELSRPWAGRRRSRRSSSTIRTCCWPRTSASRRSCALRKLARGMRQIIGTLFPGMERAPWPSARLAAPSCACRNSDWDRRACHGLEHAEQPNPLTRPWPVTQNATGGDQRSHRPDQRRVHARRAGQAQRRRTR